MVETPHQYVRQVIDRAYAKSRLEPLDNERAAADPEKARPRIRNLREARAILCRFARQHRGGRVLAVAQKGVRKALEALGRLPRNVALAHHNAVAGRDEWGGVSGLVVIAAQRRRPRMQSAWSRLLPAWPCPPLAGWYPRIPAVREMASGEDIAAEADARAENGEHQRFISPQVRDDRLCVGTGAGSHDTSASRTAHGSTFLLAAANQRFLKLPQPPSRSHSRKIGGVSQPGIILEK